MKSTKCAQCGFVGWSDENCKACGAPLFQRSTSLPPASRAYSTQQQPWTEQEGPEQGMAVTALILGILSFFTFGLLVVGAIVGIVLAVNAMGRVRREPWRYGGRSLAIAGLVLNIVALTTAVPMGGIVAAIAIPNLLASRRAANEASAIHSLRTIASAEAVYQSTAGNGKYGTLEQLVASNLIDRNLGAGVKNGYNFEVTLNNESPEGFEVTGVPTTYRSSGLRSFYVDETLVIRGGDNSGGPSTKMDDPLQIEPTFGDGARRIDYVPAN